MARDNQDLTKGPLARKILFFSAPLIVSNLLQVLFNVADIAVVGRFAGASALGSVGSTTILVTMFTSFLIGVSGGINVLTALYLGSGDRKGVRETVHSAFLFSILTGLTLLLIGAIFSKGILELLNTKPELIDGAVLYIRIYFLGMPALAVYNFGNAVFSAAGDTKRPLKYLSMAGVVNIILNLFFVIVCKMDVAGVAVSSIISPWPVTWANLLYIQYGTSESIVNAIFASSDKLKPNHAKSIDTPTYSELSRRVSSLEKDFADLNEKYNRLLHEHEELIKRAHVNIQNVQYSNIGINDRTDMAAEENPFEKK